MTTSDGTTPPPGPAVSATVEEDAPPPAWDTDERISFSRETGKYLQTNEDGSEMEYNSKLKAWMPVVRVPSLCAMLTYNRSMMMN